MKLKIYNRQTVQTTSKGEARISLALKTGVIYFTKQAVSDLKITDGGTVQLLQDESRTQDWYIQPNVENGFKLKATKDGVLSFSSCGVVRAVFESVKFTGNSANMIVSSNPIEEDGSSLYAIITKSIKFKGQSADSIHDKM